MKKKVFDRFLLLFSRFQVSIERARNRHIQAQIGYMGKGAEIRMPSHMWSVDRIRIEDNSVIHAGANFIISGRSESGNLIMKKNSGSAENLTIVTGNHQRTVDTLFRDKDTEYLNDYDEDIIIEEEVWLGINVTILAGSIIGRGATIGAGSVVRGKIPPYAVVTGNPAKVVGFNFTPEEVVEHEKLFYQEQERLPMELLEKNYKKYFLDHIKEIKTYTSLICK